MVTPQDHYQPFWIWPVVFGGIGAIVAVFWLLNRIVERFFPSARGKRYTAAMGNALMRIDAVLNPGREHMVEVRKHQQVDKDEPGEPPETGGSH